MILAGNPLKGKALKSLREFLKKMDVEYDDGIEYSRCLLDDDGHMIAAGSVKNNVLKCIAADSRHRERKLLEALLSELIQYEFERGRNHLFVNSKPEHKAVFEELGFYTILETEEILFMENRSSGFDSYLEIIRKETPADALEKGKKIGAVVMNCDPFTLGHRYLLEEARGSCDYLHVFILSDHISVIPFEDRYRLVAAGSCHIPNLILHRTSNYLMSDATLSLSCTNDQKQPGMGNCKLDLELFARRIAPELHVQTRFAGGEPVSYMNQIYNQVMGEILFSCKMSFVEIPRIRNAAGIISASRVRDSVKSGRWMEVKKMVPDTTLEYLKKAAELTK